VGRPTGNAVVERLILTLKTELIWTQDWSSLEELQAALDAWFHVYNTQRPHQALDWLTSAPEAGEEPRARHGCQDGLLTALKARPGQGIS
jgi:transposase InsO family protein